MSEEDLQILICYAAIIGGFLLTLTIIHAVQNGLHPGPPDPDPYATGTQGWEVLDEARRIVEDAARDGA